MAVTWKQWVDGFDTTVVGASCTASVDTAASGFDRNTLTSTIASANDANDTATADVTNTSLLPSNDQGRVRFKFATGARVAGTDNHSILLVRSPAAKFPIDVYITSSGTLGLFSEANTLRSTSLNQTGSTTLQTNTEYTIEVAWKGATDATGYRRAWVNGVLQFEATSLDMVTANDCDSDRLILGIDHYDGADSSGFTHVFRYAQIANDAAVALDDPTVHARFHGPSVLGTSAATIFTATRPAQIDAVEVSNPTGSPVDLTLSVGTDAAGTRLFDGLPIKADSVTNLADNGGFETNTTTWSTAHTIARDTGRSKFGSASLLCTYTTGGDDNTAFFTLNVGSAGTYTFSCWVYVPTNWDGGAPRIVHDSTFVGSSTLETVAADLGVRDQWQRIYTVTSIAGGDTDGAFLIRLGGSAPTTGRSFSLDGAQVELGSLPTSYIETDGAPATEFYNTRRLLRLSLQLDADEIIQAFAGTGSALVVTLVGRYL